MLSQRQSSGLEIYFVAMKTNPFSITVISGNNVFIFIIAMKDFGLALIFRLQIAFEMEGKLSNKYLYFGYFAHW